MYTPKVMEQNGQIYDKLDRLPEDKRSIVVMMIEAFINGMLAQERLQDSACPGPPARARVQMEAEGGVDLCSEQQ